MNDAVHQSGDSAARGFDAPTLALFDRTEEIEIETRRDATAPTHRTTIWLVVDDGVAYVRSVRGPAGRWYRDLLADPRGAVHAAGQTAAFTAEPVTDQTTLDRVSQALERKYLALYPGPTAAMLRAEVLPTTLRLVPRSA